jgi:hypothetical protein
LYATQASAITGTSGPTSASSCLISGERAIEVISPNFR